MQARLLLRKEQATFPTIQLDSDTLHYLKDVLRLEPGTSLDVVVEGDSVYSCELMDITRAHITVKQLGSATIPSSDFPDVTIIQGLVKQDKFKTVLNCCTQAEASAFWAVETTRSVAKISNIEHKMKRWNDILYSAALQSQQTRCPVLKKACGFEAFLNSFDASAYDLCLVPWEDEAGTSLKTVLESSARPKSIAVFIGPEGGFEGTEIEALNRIGFQSVSLGRSILRTEHAGLFTLGMLHYVFD